MELVGSRFGLHHNLSRTSHSVLSTVAILDNTKFLNRVQATGHVKVDHGTRIHIVYPVNRIVTKFSAQPVVGNRSFSRQPPRIKRASSYRSTGNCSTVDTRYQQSKTQEVSAIQQEVLNMIPGDYSSRFARFRLSLHCFTHDFHLLGNLAYFKSYVMTHPQARIHFHSVSQMGFKSRFTHRDFIETRN